MKHSIIISLSILLTAVFTVGCGTGNDDDCFVSDSCDQIPWDSAYVDIKLSDNGNQGTILVFYEGYVEDNNIISIDTVWGTTDWWYWVPVGRRYAVEAYYQSGQDLTVALDGGKLKKDTYEDCGATCYREPKLELDVLKL